MIAYNYKKGPFGLFKALDVRCRQSKSVCKTWDNQVLERFNGEKVFLFKGWGFG